jgi:hypothetical protein
VRCDLRGSAVVHGLYTVPPKSQDCAPRGLEPLGHGSLASVLHGALRREYWKSSHPIAEPDSPVLDPMQRPGKRLGAWRERWL